MMYIENNLLKILTIVLDDLLNHQEREAHFIIVLKMLAKKSIELDEFSACLNQMGKDIYAVTRSFNTKECDDGYFEFNQWLSEITGGEWENG